MKLYQRKFAFICLILLVLSAFCVGPVLAETKPLKPWTIAVIPDTQYYVRSERNAPVFTEMTQWLVDHKEELNLQLVLHVGDIVDRNKTEQWDHAKKSLSVFDGKLPYVLAVGNHDLGEQVASDRSTMLNDYIKVSDNPLNEAIFGGYFEEGHLENAWYHFKYQNRDYIIFSLEFGPRNEVVAWADKIASEHADKSFILVTHEFIDQESTLFTNDGLALHTIKSTKNSPYGYGISKVGSVNSGADMWKKFISKYSNFELIVNGHYKAFEKTGPRKDDVKHLQQALAVSHRHDIYADGRVVHQMLFNAQWAPKGGDGWLRLLTFDPDGKTVHVETISPYLMRTADNPEAGLKTGWNEKYDLTFSEAK